MQTLTRRAGHTRILGVADDGHTAFGQRTAYPSLMFHGVEPVIRVPVGDVGRADEGGHLEAELDGPRSQDVRNLEPLTALLTTQRGMNSEHRLPDNLQGTVASASNVRPDTSGGSRHVSGLPVG